MDRGAGNTGTTVGRQPWCTPLPSVQMFAGVLDELAEPLCVIDEEYRVQYMNREARLLFGQGPDYDGPPRCYRISHRRETCCSGDDHPCPMTAVRETGRPVRVLHEHYDGEGAKLVVEIIASPLRDQDGIFRGIIESQRDVTAREQADLELRRYAVELEKSNRLKDLFIDIMRHDLLSPAGAIRTAAALGLRDESDALKREDLELMYCSSQRMIDLIQNASALAKLETEGHLSLGPNDIEGMIRNVVRDLAPCASGKGMRLIIAGSAGGPVPAHPLLSEVFSNIVGNAIKYSPVNSEVRIDIARQEGGCRVSVTDHGEGIPAGAREEIFTRFTRLHKGRVKGAGLGLAIARKVVDLHGGRVWAEEAPGGGSVFIVHLKTT